MLPPQSEIPFSINNNTVQLPEDLNVDYKFLRSLNQLFKILNPNPLIIMATHTMKVL